MSEMSREEWERRYAARIEERAGWTKQESAEWASVGAVMLEQNERAAGKAVVWEEPEDAADEEMSYWENDGE
jgi:hypothetical protein